MREKVFGFSLYILSVILFFTGTVWFIVSQFCYFIYDEDILYRVSVWLFIALSAASLITLMLEVFDKKKMEKEEVD